MTPDELIKLGSVTPEMIRFMQACVEAGLRIIVSGLPDTGKTATMIALARMLPSDTVAFSVEDAKELWLEDFLDYCTAYHVNTKEKELRTRNVSPSQAIKNSLNQGVEALLVSQVRMGMALSCKEAQESGLCTILSTHSVSPKDTLSKYDTVLSYETGKHNNKLDIASVTEVLLFNRRMNDHSVRIEIYEVLDNAEMNPLWIYEIQQNSKDVVKGRFIKPSRPTSKIMDRFKYASVDWDVEDIEYDIPNEVVKSA